MEIDQVKARRAFEMAYQKYPRFAEYGPRLVVRPLFKGHAFMLEYDEPPQRDDPDAWEFQNAVVKAYQLEK
jgi:hypothetical protein